MKFQLKKALFFLLFICFTHFSYAQKENTKTNPTYYGPGGTYSDWYFPKGEYESLEWTFVPVADPPSSLAKEGLLHYYAYNFGLVNANGSVGNGYAGFQTNGIFKNKQEGKVINFSIWGSNGGKTSGLLNSDNEESSGFQIMYKYEWIVGHPYRFQLKVGPSGTDSIGKWWGLWVTDQITKKKDFVGEQRIRSIINGKKIEYLGDHTYMFGEDLHWWKSLNGHKKYTDCSSFEGSACAAINISANDGKIKPIKFKNRTNSGELVTSDNGFKSVNCNVTIYEDSTNFNVQHNLGYWASPAPNYLKK